MTDPMIVVDVCSLALRTSEQPARDRPFEIQQLYTDQRTGAEHCVVRYRAAPKPGGIATRQPTPSSWSPDNSWRTVSASVLAGMRTSRADRDAPRAGAQLRLTFVLIFDGPFDLDVLQTPDD
jgi:hypothetical protein